MKTILLCGNGLSGEVIKKIKSWGYRVALISEFPNDVGVRDADVFIHANSKCPEEALAAANRIVEDGNHIDGVMSLCWDSAVSVAKIAHHFGLKSPSIETAEKATYKDLRSLALKEGKIPAPKFTLVESLSQLRYEIKRYKLPVAIKPCRS